MKPTAEELLAIKRAAEGVKKWHDEKLGFIPSVFSFRELMGILSK